MLQVDADQSAFAFVVQIHAVLDFIRLYRGAVGQVDVKGVRGWIVGDFLASLPPRILQPRDPIKHRLSARHMVHPVRHKITKPLKLKLLSGSRCRQ